MIRSTIGESCTLDQLPATATLYYEQSLQPGLFERVEIGKDVCGRRVFQKFFDGKEYGEPMALLTYAEYKAKVLGWVKKYSTPMGIQRWTTAVMP